jgi:hypothetical protein
MPELRLRARGALVLLVLVAACAGQHSGLPSTDSPASQNSPHNKKVYQSGGTTLTLTPNFNTGFGPVPSVWISGKFASPAPGSNATLNGGNIDFGTISPGVDYYYQYAMELGVTASSSYQVTGSISGSLAPGIPANLLTWLTSSPANYGSLKEIYLAAGLPFGSASNPIVVASGSSGSTTLKYDYLLIVPDASLSGASTAQIEYTVVP